jgi:hypothetical protein
LVWLINAVLTHRHRPWGEWLKRGGFRQVIWPHLSARMLAPVGWLLGAEELLAVVAAEQEREAVQVGV